MKKVPFIQACKKIGVVVAVSAGMLFITIHDSSALTGDSDVYEAGVSSDNISEDTVSIVSDTSVNIAADNSSSDVSVPDTDSSDSTSQDTDSSDSASQDTGSSDINIPDSDTDSGTGNNVPADNNPSDSSINNDVSSDENTSDFDTDSSINNDVSSDDSVSDSDIGSNTDDNVSSGNNTSDSDTNGGTNDNVSTDNNTSDSDTNGGTNDNISTDNNTLDSDHFDSTETDNDVSDDSSANTAPSGSVSIGDAPSNNTVKTAPAPSTVSAQEFVYTTPNLVIRDGSSDAFYIQPSFNRSEAFLDLADKIKYNVALPIDNIPSFITQEMIIGALKCQDETGFPASVTIAQIIQESGFGNYGPGGEENQGLSYLAFQYCNLFGIKGSGTAGSVNMRTGEQLSSGAYYTITAGFRVYNTYTECIEDRTELLKRAYSDLIFGVTDANTFAVRIGSRWATSLSYSQHLISQMERYDLYRLDKMTLTDFSEMIGKFANPCPGSYLTSDFGYRDFDNQFHKGIDLGTNASAIPTYAAESGTVITAGWDDSAGNWIVIDHGNGLVTKYMHHSKIFVTEGQHVEKGQQIGITGTTGNSTGVHLHFQVEENGVAVNPAPYLSQVDQ